MVDGRINYTILDRLGNNVLGVLFRVEAEFGADVAERDARVGEGDGSDSGLDDEMSQTEDKEVGRVGVEGLFVLAEGFLEGGDVSDSDS
jgi:hypothetical protein